MIAPAENFLWPVLLQKLLVTSSQGFCALSRPLPLLLPEASLHDLPSYGFFYVVNIHRYSEIASDNEFNEFVLAHIQ